MTASRICRRPLRGFVSCGEISASGRAQGITPLHHFMNNHSRLFADRHNHINGIENFWNQAKRHMRRFIGVPEAQSGLYSKESKSRINNSDP